MRTPTSVTTMHIRQPSRMVWLSGLLLLLAEHATYDDRHAQGSEQP
jgi:hypothetical protein